MEIGDSLFFENRDSWDINVLRWRAQKKYGIRLRSQKQKGGVRVWRTE